MYRSNQRGSRVGILLCGAAFIVCLNAQAFAGKLNHIMIIWGENTNRSTALGQPYLATLSTTYADWSNYRAITHPSQGNYMAQACGLNLAIGSDPGCISRPELNIVDRLEAAGIDWREYMETMVTPCVDNGLYASKHDFFVNFTSNKTAARLAKIRGFNGATQSTYSELLGPNPPPLVMVSPNQVNDGHNNGVADFNTWLRAGGGFTFFQDMLSSKYYTDGAIFIAFDENALLDNNRVYCVAVSALAIPGYTNATVLNHYSMLRTIEDNFCLATMTANDAAAINMLAAFNTAAPVCGTPTPSPTASPSPTPSVSPTPSATATPSPTASSTPTSTPSPSLSPSATPSATASLTPSPTPSLTPTPSPSTSPSATPSPTLSPTLTPTASPTASSTPSPSTTTTPAPSATSSPTPTSSPSPTPTDTSTPVPTASVTASSTPAPSPSLTESPTPTPNAVRAWELYE